MQSWAWRRPQARKQGTAHFRRLPGLRPLLLSKDQPFFLNLWPDDMHTPWVPEFKQKDNKSWNTEEAFIPVLAEMDKQIGRLIKALDELGLSENTIVIFTSDNGPAPSFQSARAAYLRGTKNSLYEGGIRMPFLIKYPKKIKAGQVNNESQIVSRRPAQYCPAPPSAAPSAYAGEFQNLRSTRSKSVSSV